MELVLITVTERSVEICRRALGLTPVEGKPGGDGKHKRFLFTADLIGSDVEKVSGKNVLRRFICPTRSSMKLEIQTDEEGDSDDSYVPIARAKWKPRGLPKSRLREVKYRKKYVDRIIEGRSTVS